MNKAGRRRKPATAQEAQLRATIAAQFRQIEELRLLAFALDDENARLKRRQVWDGIDPQTGEVYAQAPLPYADIEDFCEQWFGSVI